MPRPERLFYVAGTWEAGCVGVLLPAFIGSGALAVLFGAFAWNHPGKGVVTREAAAETAGTCAVVAAFVLWLNGRARRDSWHVEFYEDEVRFLADRYGRARVRAPWRDIAWYSDHDADGVEIKLTGPVSSILDLHIPTRTEDERTTVLGLLDRHGVRRRD